MHWCIWKWKKTQQLDIHIHRKIEMGHSTALHTLIALNTKLKNASWYLYLICLFICHMIHLFSPALTPVLTRDHMSCPGSHFIFVFSHLSWAHSPGDPMVTPHTPLIIWCPPSKLMGPLSSVWLSLRNRRLLRVCIRTSVSGQSGQPIRPDTLASGWQSLKI